MGETVLRTTTDAVATSQQLLRLGDEALSRADRVEAKTLFSRAYERSATPEALEGLAGWRWVRRRSRCPEIRRWRARCEEAESPVREPRDVDLEMTAIALDGLARVSNQNIRPSHRATEPAPA